MRDDSSDGAIRQILEDTIPFRFLSSSERAALLSNLKRLEKKAGSIIFEQGGTDDDVFLLVSGLVETIDTVSDPPVRINRITAGRYFGERACLFDSSRENTVTAVENSLLYSLPGVRFLSLIHTSRSFAQSLGAILREKQGIFAAFDIFSAALIRGIAEGSIDIRKLLPLYQNLEPALHPGANEGWIDFNAFNYAVSRLPVNVTRNFAYLLTDDLPYEYSRPDESFTVVPSEARRRHVWEMLPGRSLVLYRNGLSDLIDFISCLCLYAVEARKIRKRISDPETLRIISGYLDGNGKDIEQFFQKIPFSQEEATGITRIWGDEAPVKLRQTVYHGEALNADIRRQTQSYNSRRTDIWTHQISKATHQLLGYQPSDLPDDMRVHIVSSNTHSVTNCLNPFLAESSEEIIKWAKENDFPDAGSEWNNLQDLAYAAARDFISVNPERASQRQAESEWGILRLHETVSTGIQVQLIDLKGLRGYSLDPDIGEFPPDPKALIINIDYAFGEQAEEIIRNLILLFGHRLASINVLGKAGALVGDRGDILVPTAFVEQTSDRFYPFGEDVSGKYEELESLAAGRMIHHGRMLTVAGKLLQNTQMVHFYRDIW
ncbi:MAG: cyclic nucleotide-binding domain-containing protein, partial [Spirochaetales bacterium]|nr:cyclic nucleotide-binding domain-containing protein [Spirochaetales bacterium]